MAKKKRNLKKIMVTVSIVVVVLTISQLVVLGMLGGMGPLAFLKENKIAKHPGNAEQYTFDLLTAMENSPLAGKNICLLGSSVAYGSSSRGYAVGEYLAARFDANLTKDTVSGTMLIDNGKSSYIQRMLNNLDPNAQYDLFVCQLSTNDATWKKPLGEISNGTDLGSFDTSTITGAMEYIIVYAQETWNCPVVFFTGSRYESAEYEAMVTTLLKLEEKYGICVLDLWTDDAFNDISEDDRSLYMYDGIHPTKAGYLYFWGPEMEAQLIEFLK